jgi:hypothetical protein
MVLVMVKSWSIRVSAAVSGMRTLSFRGRPPGGRCGPAPGSPRVRMLAARYG